MESTSLSYEIRTAYPVIVYETTPTSAQDRLLCRAACEAITNAKQTFEALNAQHHPLVIDEVPTEDGATQIAIRTNVKDKKEQILLSVLFEGLQGATRNQLEKEGSLNLSEE
jgi:hypothetical protein